MNQGVRILTVFYSLFLIILGVLGFQQAGSTISLFSGVGFGIIIFYLSIMMMLEKKWAYVLNAFCALILTVIFGIRFYASHSFNTIAMTLFSFFVLILLSIEIYRFYGKSL